MGFFKTFSEKTVLKIRPICDKILELDESMSKLTDDELKAKTQEFKDRYANGETLDDMLIEAFAVIREASWRVLRMKHYPVQLIAGVVLHRGQLAEAATGSGKTLTATAPVYLNAISGQGVHVVTVNDYLAKRDSEWMGKIYSFLGMSVGLIIHGMSDADKQKAYSCDITYCTNTELGFDYLRDNMVLHINEKRQRGFNYAIVDEVDSILIDESRTPLIISGFSDDTDDSYQKADEFVKTLNGITIVDIHDEEQSKIDALFDGSQNPYDKYADYDYVAEEKTHIASLTEKGIEKMEKYYKIDTSADEAYSEVLYFVNVALKANTLYKKNVDYVIQDGEIIIVDLSTGRTMPGRRFSNGIHQGIEAKEHVEIKAETVTLASITYQNFFRKYKKLAGMTGTAMTEKDEFDQIYGLDVVEIPTHKPVQRLDMPDKVFATKSGKNKAIMEIIQDCYNRKQPILIGTSSVEKSEEYHKLLKKAKIPHSVLNAKHHDKEAQIISQAGRLGSVTIATNMAGRGTDIILGGNAEYMALEYFRKEGWDENFIAEMTEYSETSDEEIKNARIAYREKVAEINQELIPEAEEVKALGGLFVLGTERHESRRIDNQLRGRSGRQGDAGISLFCISLEDDLMRLFGTDRVSMIMQRNLPEDMPIDFKILSNAIQKAQQNIESRHFAQRKSTLQFDAVNSIVRDSIYNQRDEVLTSTNFTSIYETLVKKYVKAVLAEASGYRHIPLEIYEQLKAKEKTFMFLIKFDDYDEEALSQLSFDEVCDVAASKILDAIYETCAAMAPNGCERVQYDASVDFQRTNLLRNIDINWKAQMESMDAIKEAAFLQAYGQVDPVRAYRTMVSESFIDMQVNTYEGIIRNMMMVLSAKRKLEKLAEKK